MVLMCFCFPTLFLQEMLEVHVNVDDLWCFLKLDTRWIFNYSCKSVLTIETSLCLGQQYILFGTQIKILKIAHTHLII